MQPDFWRARWAEGRIGFHEGRPNDFLVAHAARLGAGRRVLVPLCGKAEDLAWLAAQGHAVVGVELVEDAARAFFAEHDVEPEVSPADALRRYRGGAVEILAGDFFATTRAAVGAVDAFYDRAALIALPPDLRARYVAHLRALLPAGAPGLLITLEHDDAGGPPHSVLADEVHTLWAGARLDELDVRETRRSAGGAARERCYAIVA